MTGRMEPLLGIRNLSELGGRGVYDDMEWWVEIRRRVLVEGTSKRQILRETGLHWTTLEKILAFSEPPGYRLGQSRQRPKLGPYLDRIQQILKEDKEAPRKQRHTAKRIFERLKEEDYTGCYTQVKQAVRELLLRHQEVFVPLVHRHGEAQVDFGYALISEGGTLRKVVFFVMSLPYSDAFLSRYLTASARKCSGRPTAGRLSSLAGRRGASRMTTTGSWWPR